MLELFREAIAAQPDPELVAIYFKQLTDYYKDDGEGSPEEIIAEYDRLSPVFDGATGQAAEYKDQFDKCFGLSGVASCENLEAMFKEKIAASNNDPDVLAQAVDLMTRAKCDSEFYLTTAEKYYEVKPSAETALFLAQAFQNKQEYDKAIKYLTEALAVETDNVEKEKLLVRIGVVQLATKNYAEARKAALEAQALNPEDGMTYFVLAQCYGAQASGANFTSQAMYWVAYDTMEKAAQLLEEADLKKTATKMMAAFRSAWPSRRSASSMKCRPVSAMSSTALRRRFAASANQAPAKMARLIGRYVLVALSLPECYLYTRATSLLPQRAAAATGADDRVQRTPVGHHVRERALLFLQGAAARDIRWSGAVPRVPQGIRSPPTGRAPRWRRSTPC